MNILVGFQKRLNQALANFLVGVLEIFKQHQVSGILAGHFPISRAAHAVGEHKQPAAGLQLGFFFRDEKGGIVFVIFLFPADMEFERVIELQ
ncbi:MAG: hypothetical protein BWY83_02872 [bacterium ADurb.Bin478]|nr:MAG: hypothetical protein BWY83_02872 [bacterium ADurb.Bin478]